MLPGVFVCFALGTPPPHPPVPILGAVFSEKPFQTTTPLSGLGHEPSLCPTARHLHAQHLPHCVCFLKSRVWTRGNSAPYMFNNQMATTQRKLSSAAALVASLEGE